MDDKPLKRRGKDDAGGSSGGAVEPFAPRAGAKRPARGRGGAGDVVPLADARKARPPRGKGRNLSLEGDIGRQLKTIYNDVLTQPIPDRFLELLDKLDLDSRSSGGDR